MRDVLDKLIDSLPSFTRVYQGGHHDVWCNGLMHRKAVGGYCHDDIAVPTTQYREYLCDCERWKS